MRQELRYGVMVIPIAAMVLSLLASIISEETFLAAALSTNSWILQNFYLLISWIAGAALLTLIGLAVSPVGNYIIGGPGAEKRLPMGRWAMITLCSTIAVGLLFWGVAEPILHFGAPQPDGVVEPRSDGAAIFAMSSVYLHWTFLPYATYCFTGLVMALLIGSNPDNLSVSGPLKARFGAYMPDWLVTVIDAVALFALVAGVCASLGTGVLSLSGGVGELMGVPANDIVTLTITMSVVAAFMLSSISGLHKGITILSVWNIRLFLAFLILILVVFPPTLFGDMLWSAGQDYVGTFVGRVTAQDAVGQSGWYRNWTSFHLSNWIAWAPVSAIFLAYIARGYSVRAFIMVNLLIPALFSYLWFSLLGGASIFLDQDTSVITAAMDSGGEEAAFYAFVNFLPGADILVPLFLVMSFLSFVTAADSNTISIVTLCTRTENPVLGRRLKIMWGLLLGMTAWLMITVAGVDALRILSVVGGLPGMFILLAYGAALLHWTRGEVRRQPRAA